MKNVTITLVVLFFSLAIKAQRLYFVYIQTENSQPFFLTVNETIHGSTPSGYLILSKLRDSTYRFSIGFPNNISPEQKFSVPINRKDHGYILKDFGTKGWGLFDLQTMAVQMSASVPSVSNVDFAVLRTTVDAFTAMLSRATDDPSLLQRIIIPRPEEKKSVVVKKEEIKDKSAEERKKDVSLKTGKSPSKKEEVKGKKIEEKVENKKVVALDPEKDPVKKEEADKKVPDEKAERNKDVALNKGTPVKEQDKERVVEDQSEVKKETSEKPPEKKEEIKTNTKEPPVNKGEVTIQTSPDLKIPDEKTEIQYKKSKVVKRSESSTTEGFGLVFIDEAAEGQKDTIRIMIPNDNWVAGRNDVKSQPKQERKFLDIDDPQTIKDATTKVKNENAPPVVSPNVKSIRINSCNQLATESDFFKLRKRMAAQSKENNMIDEAKKHFSSKCYTTEQVKNLSALFLTNGGKYKFFDSAYSHVSDLENFSSLETELKDEYFIKRFKAIIY